MKKLGGFLIVLLGLGICSIILFFFVILGGPHGQDNIMDIGVLYVIFLFVEILIALIFIRNGFLLIKEKDSRNSNIAIFLSLIVMIMPFVYFLIKLSQSRIISL